MWEEGEQTSKGPEQSAGRIGRGDPCAGANRGESSERKWRGILTVLGMGGLGVPVCQAGPAEPRGDGGIVCPECISGRICRSKDPKVRDGNYRLDPEALRYLLCLDRGDVG